MLNRAAFPAVAVAIVDIINGDFWSAVNKYFFIFLLTSELVIAVLIMLCQNNTNCVPVEITRSFHLHLSRCYANTFNSNENMFSLLYTCQQKSVYVNLRLAFRCHSGICILFSHYMPHKIWKNPNGLISS